MKYFRNNYTYMTVEKFDKLIAYIKASENVSTIWLPGIGRTASANSFQDKKVIENTFSDNELKKIHFLTLDFSLNNEYFAKFLEETLTIYSQGVGIRNKLIDILKFKDKICFFVDNYDSAKAERMKYLHSLEYAAPGKIFFILLSHPSEIFGEDGGKFLETQMSHNIMYFGYLDDNQSYEWIKTNQGLYDLNLKDNQIEEIIDFAGGVPGIMRCTLKNINKYESIPKTLKSQEMIGVLNNLWSRFSQSEKHIIKTLFLGNEIKNYSYVANYLRKLNIIDENNNVRGNWIEILLKSSNSIIIDIEGISLLWDGIYLNQSFTDIELKIFKLLLRNVKKIISRDQISDVIWDDPKDFSNWALDKNISRLRSKLDEIGIGSERLVTIKKKGYRLIDVKVNYI